MAHAGPALVAVAKGDAAAARTAVGRARETVAGATRRERQHVEALSALVGGETGRGLDLVAEHVAEFPRDALLVNQASSAIGFAGRSDREEYRMAFLERLAPAYGDDWWFQSALAFTYHEVDRYEESRRLSERSLQQYPGNANASHNLAHIYFETLDTEAGAAFLADWLTRYDARASFHCHLAWHLAMFELHQGRYAQALEIFDRDIVAAVNPRLAMIDGSACCGGSGSTARTAAGRPLAWRSLADLAERVSRPGFVFGEIHAALAYAASGDGGALTRLMDGLRADAKGHPIAGRVALPMVQGIAAFAAGDHAGALAHLEPVEGECTASVAATPSGSSSRRRWWSATSRSSASTRPCAWCGGGCRVAPRRATSAGSSAPTPGSPPRHRRDPVRTADRAPRFRRGPELSTYPRSVPASPGRSERWGCARK